MKSILTTFLFFGLTLKVLAFDATLNFTAVPSTAKIYFDGQLSGTGHASITLERAVLVEVKIVNEGYTTFNRSYRYGKGSQFAKNEGKGGYERGSNSYTITLEKDETVVKAEQSNTELKESSVKSDTANTFFNVVVDKKYSSPDAWKIVNKIVSDYFDDLDDTKVETGNLKSTWQTKIIGTKKVRTRIIIRTDTETPLTYKIKVQSEYTDDVNASAKDDEKFKEWDRVLKKYANVFSDFNKTLTTK